MSLFTVLVIICLFQIQNFDSLKSSDERNYEKNPQPWNDHYFNSNNNQSDYLKKFNDYKSFKLIHQPVKLLVDTTNPIFLYPEEGEVFSTLQSIPYYIKITYSPPNIQYTVTFSCHYTDSSSASTQQTTFPNQSAAFPPFNGENKAGVCSLDAHGTDDSTTRVEFLVQKDVVSPMGSFFFGITMDSALQVISRII